MADKFTFTAVQRANLRTELATTLLYTERQSASYEKASPSVGSKTWCVLKNANQAGWGQATGRVPQW